MTLLDGYRVLSFNHMLMGPAAAQTLGDLGADVIAVEPVTGAFQRNWAVGNLFIDGQSVNHINVDRNKRSLAVNLKAPEGREIAQALVKTADVVMENYRPGTMEKLGLGYEDCKALNPMIVYAAATGYGRDGPYKERPGQDMLAQALSGIAATTGSSDGPPVPVGPTIVDHHGAALLALGIVSALLGRSKSGKGCRVDVDLLSSGLDLQLESIGCYINGHRASSMRGPGNIAAWFSPAPYGIYATRDGWLAISMTNMKALAAAFDLPAVAAYSEAESFSRREEIYPLVVDAVGQRATAAWLEHLADHPAVWIAPVQDLEDIQSDPQIAHNGSFVTLPGVTGAPIRVVAHPLTYDGERPDVRLPPQHLGAHTREILAGLDYDAARIADLERDGVIATHAADGPVAG